MKIVKSAMLLAFTVVSLTAGAVEAGNTPEADRNEPAAGKWGCFVDFRGWWCLSDGDTTQK